MAGYDMNWGQTPLNSLNGTPDYLQSLTPDYLQNVNLAAGTAAPSVMGGVGDWFNNSGFFGSTAADGTKTQGWGGTAIGVAQGLGNAFLGMKQYGLAKDQLAFGKEQFNKNYAAQQKTTNAAFEDRQRARVASNPGAYQSVGDYMKQNGI
jgi:hypothetical protein